MNTPTKSVSAHIEDLARSLKWDVVTHTKGDACEILSDAEAQRHTIWLPDPASANPPRPIETLHEYCHAACAERFHHLFSGSVFSSSTAPNDIELLTPLFRAANDWYVDGLLVSLCPDEEKTEIKEHYDLITNLLAHDNKGGLDILLSASMMFAQAQHYLDITTNAGGLLLGLTSTFLQSPPADPSLANLHHLVNALCTPLRGPLHHSYTIDVVQDIGLEVWQISSADFTPDQARTDPL